MNTTGKDSDDILSRNTIGSVRCKYHGPTCEDPNWCDTHRPKKYDGDGNLEVPNPARLQVGHVVRSTFSDGSVCHHPFTDSVVIRIYIQDSSGHRIPYDTIADAQKDGRNDILVELARPYLYEHLSGYLMGAERYDVYAHRFIKSYRVVVEASGAYHRYTQTFSTEYHEVREAERREQARKAAKVG